MDILIQKGNERCKLLLVFGYPLLGVLAFGRVKKGNKNLLCCYIPSLFSALALSQMYFLYLSLSRKDLGGKKENKKSPCWEKSNIAKILL